MSPRNLGGTFHQACIHQAAPHFVHQRNQLVAIGCRVVSARGRSRAASRRRSLVRARWASNRSGPIKTDLRAGARSDQNAVPFSSNSLWHISFRPKGQVLQTHRASAEHQGIKRCAEQRRSGCSYPKTPWSSSLPSRTRRSSECVRPVYQPISRREGEE